MADVAEEDLHELEGLWPSLDLGARGLEVGELVGAVASESVFAVDLVLIANLEKLIADAN